ncbi:MAG: PD-(D/E)XK nuclease family protein [Clostridia bacterium]|nr:PD-(D/E)XK nuclease family protein [Clostridia bacterium]
MVKLILTNTYYSVFSILNQKLNDSVNRIDGKNLIFCEEKISLMAERSICTAFDGTFNTDVYSFGNYMRAKKSQTDVLSKEGSAMVVKRVLSSTPLQVLKTNKQNLAPTLFELISQLKSASVTPIDLEVAIDQNQKGVSTLLKNKLKDVIEIFNGYQAFLQKNNYEDQSSSLDDLWKILESDVELENTDVYLIGLSSFTSQTKKAINVLLKKAKSVTAILVEGDNHYAYVNETSSCFKSLCKQLDINLVIERADSELNKEQEVILKGLFNPLTKNSPKLQTDKIYTLTAKTVSEETQSVALAIKALVNSKKARYKDVTIAIENLNDYREEIKEYFTLLDIPFFIDERVKPFNHPLIHLILDFYDLKRKGVNKQNLLAFIKNPLVLEDKDFADDFESYLLKYNLFYNRFLEPFNFPSNSKRQLNELESERVKICGLLNCTNAKQLLETLGVKEKLEKITARLKELGESEHASINEQIYRLIDGLLTQMQGILGDFKLDYTEIKSVFTSGVDALELAIIPQYDDAVFIGGLKQATLGRAERLFVMGLTDAVPSAQEDVALLSDGDIDELEKVKVMIEPKVRVINRRVKERVALGVCAFNKELYLSYPLTSSSNGKNARSEVFSFITDNFTCKQFPKTDAYYTQKQGVLSFAKACSDFYDGIISDFTEHSAFYLINGDKKLNELLNECNKEIKVYLEKNKQAIIQNVSSPTFIESYYECPYKAFLSRGLNIKTTDDGRINAISFGNVMHEIFAGYVKAIDKVTDRKTSDELFEVCKQKVLSNPEYQRFLKDLTDAYSFNKALNECKNYCYKTYLSSTHSLFKTDVRDIEVFFGDKKEGSNYTPRYPALSLANGRVKLSGKIDRIDTYKDYIRVVDYKTGKADASLNSLFAGVKLQLFLYGAIIKDKKLAGAYYLPIDESFSDTDKSQEPMAVGKTLNDEEIITALDDTVLKDGKGKFIPLTVKDGVVEGATDGEVMGALVTYAVKMSEQAVGQMMDGVIVPSPFGDACKYCPYTAMCESDQVASRKVKTVHETLIRQAVEKESEND